MDAVRAQLQEILRSVTLLLADLSPYRDFVDHVAKSLGDRTPNGRDFEHVAVALLFEAALRPGPTGKNSRGENAYPLLAAKHLLALGDYPADVRVPIPEVGLSLLQVKNLASGRDKAKEIIVADDPRGPMSFGLRSRIAGIAGHYGADRHVFRSGSPSLQKVAAALWHEIETVLAEPDVVDTLLARLAIIEQSGWSGRVSPNRSSMRGTAHIPQDLDAPPSILVGRDEPLKRLAQARHARVFFVSGPAGVGKTSIALALAHRLADAYPDGQLQLDMRGYSNRPMLTTDDAMRSILERFGYSGESLPAEHSLLVNAYRSLLSVKKALILLDNIVDPLTVADLLPGQGEVVMIVTSRRRMPSLRSRFPVASEELATLPLSAGLEVLRWYVGARADAAGKSVKAIVKLCDGLPLALTAVGLRLADRPGQRLSKAARELTSENVLSYLAPESAVAVEQVLDWSTKFLSPRQLDLVIDLANSPVGYITADMVRAIGYLVSDFDQVVNENLITAVEDGDAFYIHDLMRAHLCSDQVRARRSEGDDTAAAETISELVADKAQALLEEIWEQRLASSSRDLPRRLRLLAPGRTYPSSIYLDREMLAANLESVSQRYLSTGQYFNSAAARLVSAQLAIETGHWDLAGKRLLDMLPMFTNYRDMVKKPSLREWTEIDDLYRRTVNDLYFRARLFLARSGWTKRTLAITVWFGLAFAQEGYLTGTHSAAPERYFGEGHPEDLWLAVQESNDLLSLDTGTGGDFLALATGGSRRDDVIYRRRMQVLYSYELRAGNRLVRGDRDGAISSLSSLYAASRDTAAELPSVDLLWSVEPPLIRYALLLLEADQKDEAIEVLKWVETLYESRYYSNGHQRAVALLIDELSRPGAPAGDEVASSRIQILDVVFPENQQTQL